MKKTRKRISKCHHIAIIFETHDTHLAMILFNHLILKKIVPNQMNNNKKNVQVFEQITLAQCFNALKTW